MPLESIRLYILLLGFAVGLWTSAHAGDGCCAQCGCAASCRKVCRLVYEDKKVEVVCWGCKCEEFCVAGPSKPGCKRCDCVCTTCDEGADSNVCAKPKRFVWFDWLPGCAHVHTRTKLMRKTVTVTVPSHKWIIEDLCADCRASCSASIDESNEALPHPAE
jgi:hypothetical protein